MRLSTFFTVDIHALCLPPSPLQEWDRIQYSTKRKESSNKEMLYWLLVPLREGGRNQRNYFVKTARLLCFAVCDSKVPDAINLIFSLSRNVRSSQLFSMY